MNIWAIIPVKQLFDSKSRLAHILQADERASLTGQLLQTTLDVLKRVPDLEEVLVVSRDSRALKIARNAGALTYRETEKQDLNTALTRASHIAVAKKVDCVLIIPADLPFITEEDVELMLSSAEEQIFTGGSSNNGCKHRGVAICSDHNSDGSNAMLVCPPAGFTFQYGPNSFHRHLEEAARLGMSVRIVDAPGLKFDIDTEEDWNEYLASQTDMARAAI